MSAKRDEDVRPCPYCNTRVVWEGGAPAQHRRHGYTLLNDPTCQELAAAGEKAPMRAEPQKRKTGRRKAA